MNAAPASQLFSPIQSLGRLPSPLLLLGECRAIFEVGATVALWPLLCLASKGDGHPVLVLPGFLAGDESTVVLRGYLCALGYDAQGWRLGLNVGRRRGVHAAMARRLHELSEDGLRKVSIVGWSLSGALARQLAARHAGIVRSVVTLGSPISGRLIDTSVDLRYRGISSHTRAEPGLATRVARAPKVPTTSIYSRSDGIVPWRASAMQDAAQSENIEVHGSHVGLGANPAVLYAVADRLSQPEGAWRPFSRNGPGALVFPDPRRPA